MKMEFHKRSRVIIQAFERGRKDGQTKFKSIAEVPYRDREKAEAWERGFEFSRKKLPR